MTSFRRVSAILVALLVAAAGVGAAAQEIAGVAEVRSGSEIALGGKVVRLFGVEAPAPDDTCEFDQGQYRCGVVAWAELVRLADGRHLSCDVEARGEAGAVLATCYRGEQDLNEALILSGWAEARAEDGRYRADEEEARRARRGLWAERIRPPDRRQAP